MRIFAIIFVLSLLRSCGIPFPVPRAATTDFVSPQTAHKQHTISTTYHQFGPPIDLTTVGPSTFESQLDYQIGSDGWMLWNPHNIYSIPGLKSLEEI